MSEHRQIFLHGALGQRQLSEVLGSLMSGLILCPEEIWLVSAWISDFVLLNNRTGSWDVLDSSWGCRDVMFSEVLVLVVNSGCKLNVVVNDRIDNHRFINTLSKQIGGHENYRCEISAPLHTKGLLSQSFFLRGSMNFTYSGTNKNDEHVTLTTHADTISEARIEFEGHYFNGSAV